MDSVERVTEWQDVYDLIIATCEHDAEFKAWGASALRFLNRTEAELTALQARVVELEGAMKRAKVLIGARNDHAAEAIRQVNVNQAWHVLHAALGSKPNE